MNGRTILILFLMLAVVLITSAVGAYQDHDKDDDDYERKDKHSDKDKDNGHKHATDTTVKNERTIDTSNLIGASGAGMPHKVSHSYLDTSVKAKGPYVDDGTNSYKGKARGYSLHDSESDSENETSHIHNRGIKHESESSDSDSDNEDGNNTNYDESEFSRKIKYITKTISNLFKEIFSKWGNQGTIMAPSGMEEMNPDVSLSSVEGLRVREQLQKRVKNGMRTIKGAFKGRRRS
jgi:uncharacterized protein YxeA